MLWFNSQDGGDRLVKYGYGMCGSKMIIMLSSINSVDVQYDTGVEYRGILVPLKERGKNDLLAWLNTTGPMYIPSYLGA